MQKLLFLFLVIGIAPVALADNQMSLREKIYSYASQGDLIKLKNLQKSGYSLDMPDSKGQQAVCEAVEKKDVKAFKTLQKAGANMNVYCLYKISQENPDELVPMQYTFPLVASMMEEDEEPVPTKVIPEKRNVYIHPYASLKINYSKLNMDNNISDALGSYEGAKKDWVWGGSVAVGLKACAFRAELEYNQSTTAKDTRHASGGLYDTVRGKQSYRSYMLNGYFDIPTYTPVHPYIGAGIGLAQVKSRLAFLNTDSVTDQKKNNFAYQLMAGVGYDLNPHWTLDMGYRYVDNGDTTWDIAGGAAKVKFDSKEHQMSAGIRYNF